MRRAKHLFCEVNVEYSVIVNIFPQETYITDDLPKKDAPLEVTWVLCNSGQATSNLILFSLKNNAKKSRIIRENKYRYHICFLRIFTIDLN